MNFEYKTELLYLDSNYAFGQKLNELGQEGWELVTVIETTPAYDPTNKIFTAYFKRRIEE